MKRYENSSKYNVEKRKAQEWKHEHKAGGFRCTHCKRFVVINDIMGTANRNHCNFCLWSKHVDESTGDRQALCNGGMKPVGLIFKQEGYTNIGEIMLIHLCSMCQKVSINRIVRDDLDDGIFEIFTQSTILDDVVRRRLMEDGIYVLGEEDEKELRMQLYGK